MRYFLILAIHLTIATMALAQGVTYPDKKDKSIVRLSEFYDGCGKIFDNKNYLTPLDAKSIIASTPEDILKAEQLMDEKFSNLIKSEEVLKAMVGKSFKKEYREFYRQYVSFNNNEDDKILVIHLIKCCKGNIGRCFPNWKKELGNPLDEDPCTITLSYSVNLNKKTISVY